MKKLILLCLLACFAYYAGLVVAPRTWALAFKRSPAFSRVYVNLAESDSTLSEHYSVAIIGRSGGRWIILEEF